MKVSVHIDSVSVFLNPGSSPDILKVLQTMSQTFEDLRSDIAALTASNETERTARAALVALLLQIKSLLASAGQNGLTPEQVQTLRDEISAVTEANAQDAADINAVVAANTPPVAP